MVIKNTKDKSDIEYNMDTILNKEIVEDRPYGRENRSQKAQVDSNMNMRIKKHDGSPE